MIVPATLVLLALSSAGGLDSPGPAPVVSAVSLRLPEGEDAAAVGAMVEVNPGRPLSLRAVRRTVQLLYQLGRFSNVVVRAVPAAAAASGEEQVVLLVECLPKRIIRTVSLRIDARSPAIPAVALGKAANLPPGEELYEERLEAAAQAVRAAYQRRGWRRAQVSAKAQGEREAAIEIEVAEGRPTRVASLEIGSQPGPPEADLRRDLRTRPGAILDLDALDDDIRTIRAGLRRAGYLRAQVGAPAIAERGDEASVRIPVELGPKILFRFPGSRSYSDPELKAQLGLDGDQPFDAPAVESAAARLADFLRARGFAEARVKPEERDSGETVVVLFRMEESRRYRVGEVRFIGASARSPAWLAARLAEALEEEAREEPPAGRAQMDGLAAASGAPVGDPARSFRRADPADAWHEPTWDRAVGRVLDLYRVDGYLDAAHEGTRLVLDARRGVLDVEIRLREGEQTRVESISFEGNKAISLLELARQSKLAPGDPLSFPRLEQTRVALVELYARAGFAYARVEDEEKLSEDRRSAAVRFRVEEGPRVRIANVVVAGARRTREDLVRSVLILKKGQLFDPDAAARSQSALLRLGVFRSVALRLNDPDLPEPTKDLTVEVAEGPWQTLAPGFGFSLANGPRVVLEYSLPNLDGRALEFAARAKVNYLVDLPRLGITWPQPKGIERLEGRADFGIHYPRLHFLPFTAGARLDAIAERVHRKAYDLTRASTVLGLDWTATNRVTLLLQYELEIDRILKNPSLVPLTQADVERLRFPEGTTTLHSLRPVLAVDFRDSSVHPRSGWFASALLDLSHSLGADPDTDGYVNMLKAAATLSGYLPIGSGSVLALLARGGQVFPLDPRSNTIAPKRFFLGGATTMRGYAEDEMLPEDRRASYIAQRNSCTPASCTDAGSQLVSGQTLISEGGQSFLLLKAEVRLPLRGSVEAGIFTDVGNLWLDPTGLDPTSSKFGELRTNAGVGLRFVTPIGPAALDVGFNLEPDPRLNERTAALHFSVGLF